MTVGQRGGAARPGGEGGFTVRESPAFLGDEGRQQDEWGSPSKNLPVLTPSRSVRRGGKGGEGPGGGGGVIPKAVSIPDDVSVSTRYIREVVLPGGQVKSLLQRGGLDRREREVVRKAQEVQWRMLYDVKEPGKKKKEGGGGGGRRPRKVPSWHRDGGGSGKGCFCGAYTCADWRGRD